MYLERVRGEFAVIKRMPELLDDPPQHRQHGHAA